MFKQKGNLSLLLGGFMALAVLGVGSYYLLMPGQSKNKQLLSVPPESPENTPNTANWTDYTNKRYGFTIKYPQNFEPGNYNAATGELQQPTGNENRIGFYQSTDFFQNFFEIQVIENSETLKQTAEESYNKNTTHFKTIRSSELKQADFLGNPSYRYTFTGSALATTQWDGLVSEKEYSVVLTQKDNIVYAFYYTNTDLFKKMQNTFVFLDQ